MATFALYWLAALIVAYVATVSLIRAGKRQEQALRVPVRAQTDADPRRRRQA